MKPKQISKKLLLHKTTVARLHDGEMLEVKAGNIATCTMDIDCWTKLDSSCQHQ